MLKHNNDHQSHQRIDPKSQAILVESLERVSEEPCSNDEKLKIYEKIFKELLPWLESEKNSTLWTQKIFAQQFVTPLGRTFLGVDILAGLSAAIYYSDNPNSNAPLESIIDDGEYGINNYIFKLFSSHAIAEVEHPTIPEADYYYTEKCIEKNYALSDNGQSAAEKIKFIEEILDQIVASQFSGNLLAITANNGEVIKKSSYGQEKDKSITGMVLLEEYCCALECIKHQYLLI